MKWLKVLLAVCCLAASGLAAAGIQDEIAADMRASRWEAASQKLDRVVKKHPDNALAWYWAAQVHEKQGRIADAASELAAAKRLDASGSFAGDKAILEALERKLDTTRSSWADRAMARAPESRDGKAGAEPEARDPGPEMSTVAQQQTQAQKTRRDLTPAQESGAIVMLGKMIGVAAGIAALVGGLFWWLSRREARKRLDEDRSDLRAQLNSAKLELQDAQRALRVRAEDLSANKQFAVDERVAAAIAEVGRAEGALATQTDFRGARELLARAKSVAAQARGDVESRERRTAPISERVVERVVVRDRDPHIVAYGGSSSPLAYAVPVPVQVQPAAPQFRRVDMQEESVPTQSFGYARAAKAAVEIAQVAESSVDTRGATRSDSSWGNSTPPGDAATAVDTSGSGPSMD